MTKHFYSYWGKAGQDNQCHLLPYHSLDVAACGLALLQQHPGWRSRLEKLTGLGGAEFENTLKFFLCLHDLGKFATSFQNLRPDILRSLQNRTSDKPYSQRHDSLGYMLWRDTLRQQYLPRQGGRRTPRPRGPDMWMRAVTGHHGQPPEEIERPIRDAFSPQDIESAIQFIDAALDLSGLPAFPKLPETTSATASWWLAGLTVLADWLGSNQLYFPFCDTKEPLATYWDKALNQAKRVLEDSGLDAVRPSSAFVLADCFRDPPPQLRPTPLQQWAQDVPLTSGPALVILEDITGTGKTEAALLLAHRLMQTNEGGGLYFGLPTMATANSLYERMGNAYSKLFSPDSRPSLVLAHSRAKLVSAFRDSVLPPPSPEWSYQDGYDTAGPQCSAWLADNRKKALLATVGVGTVDQSLLAVLPTRHQSLRLVGLLDKILIVDEVHACDPYMNTILKHLLHAHAMTGGTAILLSATLPQSQRYALMASFAEGAGWQIPTKEELSQDYPLATVLDKTGLREDPIDPVPDKARKVDVEFVENPETAEQVLAEAVARGQCACWICNTVDSATARFSSLVEKHPDWTVDLFHARFTLADRLKIEEKILYSFGKDSGPGTRKGHILIATQVVEQSLDLDFDVLVTDLAPIDLLIQRAGRLHRHNRNKEGKHVLGEDERGTPTLTVFAPKWSDDPQRDWLKQALPKTGFVYESQDAHLWLAMKLLRQQGGFTMPDEARKLIEGVYSADPFSDIPDGLRDAALEAEALTRGKGSRAAINQLVFPEGYRLKDGWPDEDQVKTRLGEPTKTIYLARLENESLAPLHATPQQTSPSWMLSSLTVRASLAARDIPPGDISQSDWEQIKAALVGVSRWDLLVVMKPQGEEKWTGQVIDKSGKTVDILYDSKNGMTWG